MKQSRMLGFKISLPLRSPPQKEDLFTYTNFKQGIERVIHEYFERSIIPPPITYSELSMSKFWNTSYPRVLQGIHCRSFV